MSDTTPVGPKSWRNPLNPYYRSVMPKRLSGPKVNGTLTKPVGNQRDAATGRFTSNYSNYLRYYS